MKQIVYSVKTLCIAFVLTVVTKESSAQTALADNDIKTSVTSIDSPLKSILALQPRTFEYKTRQFNHLNLPGGRQYGFIAEEFRQVFPGLVYKKPYSFMVGKNKYESATVNTINTDALIPVLVASIQQQQQQIDQLRAELEAVKKR
jgi:hypothetical protein